MSKSTLNVRIPEDQHKYLRLKSNYRNIDIQDIVSDSIELYQQQDKDYEPTLKPLIDSAKTKESHHDA